MNYFHQNGDITIYCGRAQEILPSLPHGDVCVTDPPYGQTSLEWDVWQSDWLELVKADSLWVFGSLRMFMDRSADFIGSGWTLSQDVIGPDQEPSEIDVVWEKHNGSSFHADRFRRIHEQAALFYRGQWKDIYHQTPVTLDAVRKQVRRKQRPAHMGHIERGSYTSHDGGPKMMRSVINVRSCHGYAENETQKPLGIIKPLIEFSSPVGGLVVDAFGGSGSTMLAAKELGRRGIMIELREEQCEIAARRLQQEVLFQ